MNVERSLSNAIAALTALAGALATVAGFVPEQWAEVVLAVSTGAALLAGNLREWRETFFASALPPIHIRPRRPPTLSQSPGSSGP